ncbi:MAG: hypothetical protein L6455_14135, partial [Kiritimatiellae bacterium]|nr:hypothetical protein [Kiritimatiellia bacterium]
RGYKGLTTCVERITHWVIRPTRRLFANALSALTKSEYCAIFAQYSGIDLLKGPDSLYPMNWGFRARWRRTNHCAAGSCRFCFP